MKEITNKEINSNINNILEDDLLPEYNFDYSKAQKNPYFKKNRVFIEIDEEILKAFHDQNNINFILNTLAKSINNDKLVNP